jgi:hypothetical protein
VRIETFGLQPFIRGETKSLRLLAEQAMSDLNHLLMPTAGMNTMLSGPMSRALGQPAPWRISRAIALTLTHGLFLARLLVLRCLFMASMLTWHDQGGAAAARMRRGRRCARCSETRTVGRNGHRCRKGIRRVRDIQASQLEN